ncbi:MAG TPA: RNA methyltransferase, partial [Vicinamibacterales bacterium]|nr:RNA methyltransferase [Vicinamibacterales bacterium]
GLGIRITDPNDPRVALYRGVRDPELLRAHGVFIAEGRLVVRRLLESSRFRARTVLAAPAARAGLADLLEWSDDTEVYEAELPLFRELTGFNVHRGCLAIGEWRGPAPSWQDVVPSARTVVVLERVGNPDNVGGVFRAAAALGADAILLSPGCADPLYRKSIRTSMAATLTLPFAVVERWPAGLNELRSRGFSILALTPSGEEEISGVQRPERAALLLGHEGLGLRAETLALCDRRVRIAMTPGADSLNVVTAAAVALDRFRV